MNLISNSSIFGKLSLVAVAVVAFSGQVQAQKINWGGGANNINVDSNNIGLSDTTFTFQLGTFTNGDDPATEFTPTSGNIDFWSDRWVGLDTASYNQESEPTSNEGFFSDSWIVPDDDYVGLQAYIWVYNNQVGDETSEWVLITDASGADQWNIPASTGSQQNFPTQFRVSTATDVIFGGLNNTDGEGERTVDPGSYALQTQTVVPVPESGTTLLLGLTLGSLVLRRNRQST